MRMCVCRKGVSGGHSYNLYPSVYVFPTFVVLVKGYNTLCDFLYGVRFVFNAAFSLCDYFSLPVLGVVTVVIRRVSKVPGRIFRLQNFAAIGIFLFFRESIFFPGRRIRQTTYGEKYLKEHVQGNYMVHFQTIFM